MSEPEYALAVMDMPNIAAIRTLAIEEYRTITQEINALEGFHSEKSLYNLIRLNYDDLKAKVDFYLQQYIANPRADFKEFSFQYLDINRLILNLLSTIKTYLDYTKRRLEKTYGLTSEEFLNFKQLTSNAFDQHFSYRFLEELRNYAQHCGLPVGSINISDTQDGYGLELLLERDELLNDYRMSQKLKSDLQAQAEKFNIIPLLEEKTELLEEINQRISSMLIKKLVLQGRHLLDLIIETQTKGRGIPCLLEMVLDSEDEDKATIKQKWFPYEVISEITGIKIEVKYTGEKN